MTAQSYEDTSPARAMEHVTRIKKAAGSAPAEPVLLHQPDRHFRLHRCSNQSVRPQDCDIMMTQSAYRRIVDHLAEDTTREHGGLLLGLVVKSANNAPPSVVVLCALPAKHTEGTPTSLTFKEETWIEFQQDTDEIERLTGMKLQRLGWYHSHPGLGIFLSPWDIDVCTNFDSPHHIALVVDPIRKFGGFFVRGRGGYRTHEPQGFWELPNKSAASVVEWKNTREVLSEMMIPARGLLEVDKFELSFETDDLSSAALVSGRDAGAAYVPAEPPEGTPPRPAGEEDVVSE